MVVKFTQHRCIDRYTISLSMNIDLLDLHRILQSVHVVLCYFQDRCTAILAINPLFVVEIKMKSVLVIFC